MLFTILLAVILSIDCLGVGLSYGMRHMILPTLGKVIISCCSGVAIAISMCLGKLLEGVIPGEQIHLFGECMLVCLGVFFLVRSIVGLRCETLADHDAAIGDGQCESESAVPLFQWRIPMLDIMVHILHDPQHADLDCSGQISGKEAIWLGFALAMDSFGAGVCIAWMGLSVVWVTICTLLCAYLLVSFGYRWGQYAGDKPAYRKLKLLPGMMLITLGLVRILFV